MTTEGPSPRFLVFLIYLLGDVAVFAAEAPGDLRRAATIQDQVEKIDAVIRSRSQSIPSRNANARPSEASAPAANPPNCVPPVLNGTWMDPVDGGLGVYSPVTFGSSISQGTSPITREFRLGTGNCSLVEPVARTVENASWPIEVRPNTDYFWNASASNACGSDVSPCRTFRTAGCIPTRVGAIGDSPTFGVAIAGAAILSVTSTHLETWSVEMPAAPRKLASLPLPSTGSPISVVSNGEVAAISSDEGVWLADVSDPFHPRLGARLSTATAEAMSGTLLEARAWPWPGELLLFDVSNPDAPDLLSRTPGGPSGPIWEGFLYGWDRRVFDVSDPANPSPAGAAGPEGSLDFTAGYVYAVRSISYTASELDVYSLADPVTPQLLRSMPIVAGWGWPIVSGTTLFVITNEDRLLVYDIANPASPVLLGQLPGVPFDGSGGSVVESTLVLPGGESGLSVVDASDPSVPTLAATTRRPSYSLDSRFFGNVLAEARYGIGLVLYDVTDLRAPIELGRVPLGADGSAYQIDQENGLVAALFSKDTTSSLLDIALVDIRDPLRPAIRSILEPPGGFAFFAPVLRDNLLFAADDAGTFRIWDVSNPANPVARGSVAAIAAGMGRIVVGGDLAFVSKASGGVAIIDISNLDSPFARSAIPAYIGSSFEGWSIYDPVVIDSDVLFVTGVYASCPIPDCQLSAGGGAYDVSNPDNPIRLSQPGVPLFAFRDGFGGAHLRGGVMFAGGFFSDTFWDPFHSLRTYLTGSPAEVPQLSASFRANDWGGANFVPDELGRRVSAPAWTEHRLFEATGCFPDSEAGCLVVSSVVPAGPIGICKPAFGPTPSVTLVGEAGALGANGFGAGPFSYQWFRNGTPVVGANAPSIATPSTLAVGRHRYSLRVRSAGAPACEAFSRETIVVVSAALPGEVTTLHLLPNPDGRIVWSDVPDARGFEILVDDSPDGDFGSVFGTASSGSVGHEWPPDGKVDLYFRVRAIGGCGAAP